MQTSDKEYIFIQENDDAKPKIRRPEIDCKLNKRPKGPNVLKIISFLYVSQSKARVVILDFVSTSKVKTLGQDPVRYICARFAIDPCIRS